LSAPSENPGRVYLVGAGPGDSGLMTRRALELIAQADVILHDRLIPDDALDGAREDAELLYVGKDGSAGSPSVPQGETERLMVERALAGKAVVRLKGGDPFVFGRGSEEALRLLEAGIPFEVVPGVSAGVAAGAYAGIPVTHRGLASAVAFVTGHEDPQKGATDLDWEALAAFPGTLVFYMGVKALAGIATALIDAGRPPEQPAAVIESATLPRQRTVRGRLGEIAELAAAADMRPPSITIVGDVARLGDRLGWYERGERPLGGLTVAVTRARTQASALAGRLAALGARVVEAPAIRIEWIEGPPIDPSPYDLLCLTSANGVDALFARLEDGGLDARALAGCRVAAIGPGTARQLAAHGIRADVVPERFVAEGLVEALTDSGNPAMEAPIRRALVARAHGSREVLPDALRAAGAEVDVIELYEAVAEPLAERTVRAARSADYVTFTSSSTVRFFLEALGAAGAALASTTRVVSIGPVTSASLREHGIEPHVEARSHDIEGLLEALLEDAARNAPPAVAPASGLAAPGR